MSVLTHLAYAGGIVHHSAVGHAARLAGSGRALHLTLASHLLSLAGANANGVLADACPSPGATPTDTSLNPGACAPPGLGAVGTEWISWMTWIGLIAGILGFMACGIMMSFGRRNRSHLAGEGAAGIPWVMAGITAISLSAAVVGAVLPSSGIVTS